MARWKQFSGIQGMSRPFAGVPFFTVSSGRSQVRIVFFVMMSLLILAVSLAIASTFFLCGN